MKNRTFEEAQEIANNLLGDNAYPVHCKISYEGGVIDHYATGLTKRELFAAMAMQGIMADPNVVNPINVASLAVQSADALIIELNKTKKDGRF